ncbi:MAG: YkvA family protein [Pseudomonadota bacterium]|nr:YkvA family protein [Pseudomonadota bacterium]
MSLDISITLSDADLRLFVEARNRRAEEAQKKTEVQDAASIVAAARSLLTETRGKQPPAFVVTRLKHLDTMIALIEDVGFGLPEENLSNVLAALAYFSSPDDLVPDDVPILGFIDDALVIELCVRQLQPEIDAYCDFCRWRENEATRRGESKHGLALNRVDWAEARRVETIERMHRRRNDSYTGGGSGPSLFQVR